MNKEISIKDFPNYIGKDVLFKKEGREELVEILSIDDKQLRGKINVTNGAPKWLYANPNSFDGIKFYVEDSK